MTARFLSLTPLLFFVGIFLLSGLLFAQPISPLFACLCALILAVFTFESSVPFNKKVEIFIEGSAQNTVLSMIYIFIFSAAFTYVLNLTGGTNSAVNLGLYCIPHNLILPGLFTVISFFATAIGSSMGSIAAFLPIALGIAEKTGTDFALMAGVVVSGAMLGDNLSIISDTTIAATQTTGTTMRDKFKTNILLVIPAFLITFILLYFLGQSTNNNLVDFQGTIPTLVDIINIIPYALVIMLALFGVDVIAVLVVGFFAALILGISHGTFSITQSTHLILKSFSNDVSIQEVLILALLLSGLSHIVQYNGGIDYILKAFQKKICTKGQAEASISLLVFLVNAAIGINTITILITGPVAKKIGDQFNIDKTRVASLIDIVACICQGILPYAPQLLLASSLAHISSMAILPYLYYQWAILVVVVCSIGHTWVQSAKGQSV